jgi:hypothetical protein
MVFKAVKNVTVKTFERSRALQSSSKSVCPQNVPTARFAADESVDCIRQARLNWEHGINEELLAIATEAKRKFLLIR